MKMTRFLPLILLVPFIALARPVTVKTQGNFTPTQSSQAALSSNKNRKALIISNKGTDAILVQFGTSHAGGTGGIKLAAGANLDFENPPMDSVYVVLAASTGLNSADFLEFE